MKEIYTINYKANWNGWDKHCQNANKFMRTKSFTNIDEARAFAKTVEVISAYNYIGKKIEL